jgi:TATA-box binding protein (TBP) (component of TFIID and TFIIIB)
MYHKFSAILNTIRLNIKFFDSLEDNNLFKTINEMNRKLYNKLIGAMVNIKILSHDSTLNNSSINIKLEEYYKYIDADKYNLSILPDNLNISVMSTTGKINSNFNLDNINDYLKLEEDNIVYIKYKGKQRYLKSNIIKKIKKDIKSFENQLTMVVRTYKDIKQINIKIFKNGSFQMTGCKSIEDCNIVINKIFDRFRIDTKYMSNIVNPMVINFKIDMINSNFNIGYHINGEKLYSILQNNKVTCRYEPCMHPGVNIKYKIKESDGIKLVSIFVFQSGNIIITGAKNKNQIVESYNFIKNILNSNKALIIKKNLIHLLDKNDINKILYEYS